RSARRRRARRPLVRRGHRDAEADRASCGAAAAHGASVAERRPVMLDLKLDREGVPPKDASTLVLVRGANAGGIEVFCVERNRRSGFMGGAVVFPGGKLDPEDANEGWDALATEPRGPQASTVPFA